MDQYLGQELPKALCDLIRRLSIRRVGGYCGTIHSFTTPVLDPNDASIALMKKEFSSYERLASFEFYDVMNSVLNNTSVYPIIKKLSTIDLTGDRELEPLSHISIVEDNNGETDLIYLDNRRFFVLTTSRSTLLPGDIIECRTTPINISSKASFNIIREGSRFKPAGCEEYDYAFVTQTVVEIKQYVSPDIYSIIDTEERFGGGTLQPCTHGFESAVIELSSLVKAGLTEWESDHPGNIEMPESGYYPNYDLLLEKSKILGIPCYVLNLLIEAFEKRSDNQYSFIEADWDPNYTKAQLEELERKRVAKLKKDYKEYKTSLENELKKVHRRRVALFFDAPGRITPESQKYLDEIVVKLESLAKDGYGQKGFAQSAIADAKLKSAPRPRHNFKVAMTIVAIMAIGGFTAYSWIRAKESMARFDDSVVQMAGMLDKEEFNEARSFIQEQKNAFVPSYLRFIISGKMRKCDQLIDKAIDDFVEARIGQIQAMMKANRGRIDDYTWELIKGAMNYRPDNPDLVQLREQYIAQ